MSNEAKPRDLVVPLLGMRGRGAGREASWLLMPYPCWQADWAMNRQTPFLTAGPLGGRA
ncbi:hypothetical protein [Micromonospora sp. WP24]|uniref:hypothetical protein n=1 Tax=Micromonospora sp. WP24 TaxID=2604469 RepID=UPI0016526430|nr:hypothetical protein [Micromonospora sp. WP24]